MDGYTGTPALVLNRRLDVLAANALATALHSPFAAVDDIARMIFCDPAARDFYRDWYRAAQNTVASLHLATGYRSEAQELSALANELTAVSTDFADLWKARGAGQETLEAKDFRHPDVGFLSLTARPSTSAAHRGSN